MKIAFITHYTELYGANRSLLDMIEGLRRYGVKPVVISPATGSLTDELQCKNIPVKVFPVQGWVGEVYKPQGMLCKDLGMKLYYKLRPFRRLYLNLKLMRPMLAALAAEKIDLIHTNSAVTPIGIMLAKQLRVPHVWHCREMIDLHYGYCEDWCFNITKFIMRLSDSAVTISHSLHKYKQKYLREEKTHTIYDGVAAEKKFDHYYELSKVFTPRDVPKFAIVGLIHPSKGHEEAIRALAMVVKNHPHTKLMIVGGDFGDFEKRLKRLIGFLGLENNIEFWGEVDNPYVAYEEALATLVCSKHEALGRVTVESMVTCTPVIGYDHSGTAELIEHEKTGLLYSTGYRELAAHMIKVIENQEWAHRIGVNGWRFAKENFTIEQHAGRMYSVFKEALDGVSDHEHSALARSLPPV